jgi:hypothetical protein
MIYHAARTRNFSAIIILLNLWIGLFSAEKINSPFEGHPAGGSVEEEGVVFCPPLPGFLYGPAAAIFF